MRRLSIRAALSSSFVLLSLLLVSAQGVDPPQQQTSQRKGESYSGRGTELFRFLLHLRGITPVKEADLPLHSYHDVIVIAVGNPNLRKGNPQHQAEHGHTPSEFALKALESGGSALIASENAFRLPIKSNGVENTIAVSGNKVLCTNPMSIFGGNQDCPFAIIQHEANPRLDREAEVRNLFGRNDTALNRVVAGAASCVTIEARRGSSTLQPLAKFPDFANLRDTPGGPRPVNKTEFFAVGGEITGGFLRRSHCLVFSSSVVFNNYLLLLAGSEDERLRTDNYELCQRAIEYLHGSDQSRKRCLFFDRGELIERFDDLAAMNQPIMPVPRINFEEIEGKLVDMANKGIDQAQKNGLPDKLFSNAPRSIIRWLCLLALSVLGCWFLLYRVFASGKPSNLPPPPVVANASTGPPGVFDRRQRELIRRDNLYEPVRDLIREFFVSIGITGEQGAKMPKLRITDEISKPQSFRLALKDLWRLAYGPPQVMEIKRWQEMEPYFERIRQAHADGKWRFVSAGS